MENDGKGRAGKSGEKRKPDTDERGDEYKL